MSEMWARVFTRGRDYKGSAWDKTRIFSELRKVRRVICKNDQQIMRNFSVIPCQTYRIEFFRTEANRPMKQHRVESEGLFLEKRKRLCSRVSSWKAAACWRPHWQVGS